MGSTDVSLAIFDRKRCVCAFVCVSPASAGALHAVRTLGTPVGVVRMRPAAQGSAAVACGRPRKRVAHVLAGVPLPGARASELQRERVLSVCLSGPPNTTALYAVCVSSLIHVPCHVCEIFGMWRTRVRAHVGSATTVLPVPISCLPGHGASWTRFRYQRAVSRSRLGCVRQRGHPTMVS